MSPDSSSVVAVRRSLQCLLAALLLASNAANATAQQIPAGCSTSAVSISIEVFAAAQVTPITVATLGQKIHSRAVLRKAADDSSGCAFQGGSLELTGPFFLGTGVPAVPCIGGDAGGCNPALTSIATPLFAEVLGVGNVAATGGPVYPLAYTLNASYGLGFAYSGAVPTPVSGAASLALPVVIPPDCSDGNRCTIDTLDPVQLVCRHEPSKRCLFASFMLIKTSGIRGTLSYKRQDGSKGGIPSVKMSLLQSVFTTDQESKVVRKKVKLNTTLTGPDAATASLVYPIVALEEGAGALARLQTAGLDVDLKGKVQPCPATIPAYLCHAMAQQLKSAIENELALGDGTEQAAFRQALDDLGYDEPSCCVPTTCAAEGANCGSIPDGCGGTLSCGTCTLPASCGGAGIPNQCGFFS